MRHANRIFAVLIILSVAGCHGHHHPYRDRDETDDYRNANQHWSRGPHTDH